MFLCFRYEYKKLRIEEQESREGGHDCTKTAEHIISVVGILNHEREHNSHTNGHEFLGDDENTIVTHVESDNISNIVNDVTAHDLNNSVISIVENSNDYNDE